MTVEYEEFRREIIENLRFLVEKRFGSSGQFQQPDGWWVTATDAGLFFLDDLNGMTLDPTRDIGRIFENQEELNAVRELTQALDLALDQPEAESDSALVVSPSWRAVEAAAARAFSLMQISKSKTD